MSQPQKDLYIFDLDGVLALNGHRQYLIQGTQALDEEQWRKFFDACDLDLPNHQVIHTLLKLRASADIWIWTGRPEYTAEKTKRWLIDMVGVELPVRHRPNGHWVTNAQLKLDWVSQLSRADTNRLVGIFEDDQDTIFTVQAKFPITFFKV